ncbi:MAG: hypothetical protein ACE5LU_07500 [Anaerolineae bacterium]
MNRTLLLGLAVLLGLAGIAISLVDILRPPPPEPEVTVAIAKEYIPTYTLIEPGMLDERMVKESEARRLAAYRLEEAIGMMTTTPVEPDTIIGRGEARPVEEARLVKDLDLEITSFAGRYDEMVGGQLKPGVRVNIYGYHEGQDQDNPGDVKVVARNVWVVDVRASTGEAAGQPAPTPSGAGGGGLLGGPRITDRGEVPASIITVAAEPEVVWHIIEAMGAGGYEAWVTLAGNQTFSPTPTPGPVALIQPTYTPLPTYTPFPTPTPIQVSEKPASQATPEVAGTPTPGELPTTGGEQSGN